MITNWECRCLICDNTWDSESCTEPCPACGETDDIHSEEKDAKIETAEQAAKLMVENNPEFAIEHIAKTLQADPQNLQSWLDWFNKDGEFPSS